MADLPEQQYWFGSIERCLRCNGDLKLLKSSTDKLFHQQAQRDLVTITISYSCPACNLIIKAVNSTLSVDLEPGELDSPSRFGT